MFEVRLKASELKEEGNKKIRFDATAVIANPDKKTPTKRFRLRLSELIKGKPEPLIA